MYVMTVDQRRSSTEPDAVPEVLALLAAVKPLRAFERTAGDEVQGLLDDPESVVSLTMALARTGTWSIGVGVGDVETPLADSVRATRGEAFIAARRAVDRAKSSPAHLAVEGAVHAETALLLLLTLVRGRSREGWEAIEAMATVTTQKQAAAALGISPQAMNRRLHVAGWVEEQRGRELAAHLLREAS